MPDTTLKYHSVVTALGRPFIKTTPLVEDEDKAAIESTHLSTYMETLFLFYLDRFNKKSTL